MAEDNRDPIGPELINIKSLFILLIILSFSKVSSLNKCDPGSRIGFPVSFDNLIPYSYW